jgi:HPt (histidine-containing phosphotransfer) domain-containing protein
MKGNFYDLEYLVEISAGDEAFIRDMLNEFIENTPKVIDELNSLSDSKNWESLYYVAHKFAPTFDFVGAHQIKNEIITLEKNVKELKNLNDIPTLLFNIKTFSNNIILELKKDYNI